MRGRSPDSPGAVRVARGREVWAFDLHVQLRRMPAVVGARAGARRRCRCKAPCRARGWAASQAGSNDGRMALVKDAGTSPLEHLVRLSILPATHLPHVPDRRMREREQKGCLGASQFGFKKCSEEHQARERVPVAAAASLIRKVVGISTECCCGRVAVNVMLCCFVIRARNGFAV
jgi:hypothetical protein